MLIHYFIPIVAVLFFSCTSDIEMPPPPLPPDESSSSIVYIPSSNSVPPQPQSSSSVGESTKYCVYPEAQQCFATIILSCPAGGILSDFCPPWPSEPSSASIPSPSSSSIVVVPSSSSVVIIPSSSSIVTTPSSSSIASSSSVYVPPTTPSSSSSAGNSGGGCTAANNSKFCYYGSASNCHKMPTDNCCADGILVNSCESASVEYCDYGVCKGGSGWDCKDGGGCYVKKSGDTCNGGSTVTSCPKDHLPPSANY
jgi:hypothetical protein